MATPIPCPNCEKPLPIPETALGKALTCPGCGGRANVVGEQGSLELVAAQADEEARPPARQQRTAGGRVKHKMHGQVDTDTEPAGPPPPLMMLLLALTGVSALLCIWTLYYIFANTIPFEFGLTAEQMGLPAGSRMTSHGILFTPPTIGALALCALGYLTCLVSQIQGRKWGQWALTLVAVIGIGLYMRAFNGAPWDHSIRFQVFFWAQLPLLVLPWIPITRRWVQAKDADRLREAVQRRRGARGGA